MSDDYQPPDGYDEDNTILSFDPGDFVVDIRWPDAEFEIAVVHEIEEDGILLYILEEEDYLFISEPELPYMQLVGDNYYEKMIDAESCCKKKERKAKESSR